MNCITEVDLEHIDDEIQELVNDLEYKKGKASSEMTKFIRASDNVILVEFLRNEINSPYKDIIIGEALARLLEINYKRK